MDILEENNLSTEEALRHWYYRAKFDLLVSHLRQSGFSAQTNLADVGCGLGLFLRMLRRSGSLPAKLTGVDIGFAQPLIDHDDGFTIYPSWPENKLYDTVLLMDVLEHCPDDTVVLQEATDRLKPRGHLFITVPSFQWLWSSHDVYLRHYRRYSCPTLQRLIERERRLKIVQLHYFYGLLFPPVMLQRLLHRHNRKPRSSELKTVFPLLNRILFSVCRLETAVMRKNRMFGLSTVALCRRL